MCPFMFKTIARKRQNLSLSVSFPVLDKTPFTCVCLNKNSGKTECGHPIGMFLDKTCKNCYICDQLDFPQYVLTFLGTLLHNIKFFYFSLSFYQTCFSTRQMRFFKIKIVLIGVKLSLLTSVNFSKNEPQSNNDFGRKMQLVQDFFLFPF